MKKFLLLFNFSLLVFAAKAQTCSSGTIFTGGPNAFGTGGSLATTRQNCLSYNSDLNAVLWIHRSSPDWAFPGYNTGSIQATWLDIASGAWDSTIVYYDYGSTPVNPARYPGGVFYNPVGNTSISNAYVVSSGPCLPGSGTAWGSYHSERKLTGTSADQAMPGIDLTWESPNTGMWGGSSAFINYDMQQAGAKVFVAGEARDSTTSGNASTNTVFGGIIGRCDFSSGNPVWSYDSIIPPFYFNRDGSGNGYATDGSGGRIAFDQTGAIGYWVIQGRLATDYSNSADSMLAPIVYKTTDGGVTWSLTSASQGFDWSVNHPELMKNVGLMRDPYRPFGYTARHFKINYAHGSDLVVDANGTLHFVTTFMDMVSDGAQPDSLNFSYTYQHDYINNHPVIWDLMTDGNDWSVLMVDSIITGGVGPDPAIDTTSYINPWGLNLAYGSRVQVGRSVSGDKIFYSWADSDPILTGSPSNIAPDIHMKSYDVVAQHVTPSLNMTAGNGKCYFHYMSEINYFDNIQSAWVCPLVYTTGRGLSGPPYTGTSAVDYNYVDCATFQAAQYTDSASVYRSAGPTTGVKNIFASGKISVYPNPGSGVFVVQLNNVSSLATEARVNITNVLGETVYSTIEKVSSNNFVKELDLQKFDNGSYFLKVDIGGKIYTNKIIISK